MIRLIPATAFIFALVIAAAVARLPGEPIARAGAARPSGGTTIATDTIAIPTYNYAPYLSPQVNAVYNVVYPVLNWNGYTKNKAKFVQSYTRLTLENDWLRVSLLPELGGRVYELIFKPTGHNELYRNPVIKPTGWGPPEQKWWLAAGGIEWNLPVTEHGYEGAIAWSYAIAQSSAGVTVTLRDSTAPDRLRASVEVSLPNDRAVLIVRPRIENGRGTPLDFAWWSSAMLAPGAANSVGPDLRFIFPVNAVTVHSTGDRRLPGGSDPGGPWAQLTWPNYNGVDWSRLGNFDQWFGFFGRPQAQQDFAGVYDTAADEGVVRVFPHTIVNGIKGFAMGWLHPIGWGEWTDDGSTYVELHAGLAPTFWNSVSLDPGKSIQWEEAWYPVAGIGAFTTANAEAALNVEHSGPALTVNVFSTRARASARLAVYQRSTCNLIAQRGPAAIDPATPQTLAVPTDVPLSDVSILFSAGDTLILGYNAKDCVAPASAVDALPNVSPAAFNVAWKGSDFYSGVAAYDVQFKDGHGGAWTPWLTATTQTHRAFNGAHGHTYFFRSRARDGQGNLEAYAGDEWGDAFTTVLTAPAAVMETSRKVAPNFFAPGQSVSYTIALSNTGNLIGAIALTDTLPASMTLIPNTLFASAGAPAFDGARIAWSGDVTDGATVFVAYALTPTLELGFMQPQVNVVTIAGGVAPVTRTATTSMARTLYLPAAVRLFAP